MNAVATIQKGGALTTHADALVMNALRNSLYPGASEASVMMVLDYCRAAGLDPMTKPVHIVPMWDSKLGQMRDVVMPGVGLYRTQASRTGEFAGMTEPEFGADITQKIGGVDITYPEWARVTVKRALASGIVAEFTAREYWIENYAVRGGKEKSIAPNAMWQKRPRGQLGKCAAAQALRIAFPELGAQPTAEEMEGKTLDAEVLQHVDTVTLSQGPVTPNAGVWASMDEATQAILIDCAARANELMEIGDHESAHDFIGAIVIDGKPLNNDQKTALWTKFSSSDKTALKKIHAKANAK